MVAFLSINLIKSDHVKCFKLTAFGQLLFGGLSEHLSIVAAESLHDIGLCGGQTGTTARVRGDRVTSNREQRAHGLGCAWKLSNLYFEGTLQKKNNRNFTKK